MSWLIFDAVLGIVLVLAAVQGYRKGFVLTLCGFLAVFVAFFGASVLSNALAGPVAEAIRPVVEERLEQAMQKSLEEQGWSDGEGEQPEDGSQTPAPEDQFSLEQVLELIQESKLFQSFSGALHSAVSQGLLEVTTSAAQAVAGYLAREVARMALFLICFALVLVGWPMLSRVLDLACKLPVLSTLNHWSGAALGLVKGGLIVFILCWLLRGSLISQAAVEGTVLLRFFCTHTPLSLLAPLLFR